MRAFLISDNIETRVGMRLAGIDGVIVHEREEVLREIRSALKDKEIGIIILTEQVAEGARDDVNRLKIEMSTPLIIEIPDRHGSIRDKDRITRYIKESIGIKM